MKRILILFLITIALSTFCFAETTLIQPLSNQREVKAVISRLNRQGIIFSGFDENVKKNELTWLEGKYEFHIMDTGAGWYLYKVDINNDGEDEYVLLSIQGSGSFLYIEGIYKEKNGKLVDIFNQIDFPMRRLIRDAEKETYDLKEGYVGFMDGSIRIEKENGKVFFTFEQVTRKYEGKGYEEDFNPPQSYKFLWDKSGIKLLKYSVGENVYKEYLFLKGSCGVYRDRREYQDVDGKGIEVNNPYGKGKLRVKRTDTLLTLKGLGTGIKDAEVPEIKIPSDLLPLKVGAKWADVDSLKDNPKVLDRKDKMYFNYVEKVEDVTVPAGTFNNCFKIVFRTLPDDTAEWLCPDVGIVKAEYHHHGAIDNQIIELKESCKK